MEINGQYYCSRCMREMKEEGPCPHCGFDGSGERPPAVLEEGTLLNGKYQLGAVIGKGGFGITYAAWDENLDRPVAVKEYFPSDLVTRDTGVSDEVVCVEAQETVFLEGRLRFERESHLLASLSDIPNVVKVLDFFSENNTAYIVMEYIHGRPLDEWAAERKLQPAQTLSFLQPVMDALVLLHRQGVVHRDLKPENILVEEDGTARLIDFGAAMRTERHGETIILSRGYAPVEQYGKEYGRQGPWSDVYGLAAVIYELLTGEAPQESLLRARRDELKSPAALKVKLGRKQDAALMNALAVEPEKRTQSMEEFRAGLYLLPLPEQVRWRRRMRRRLLTAFCAALLVMTAVIANFVTGLPLGQGLLYSLRKDGFHIMRQWRGGDARRTLPGSVMGIPVTAVERDAFRGDETLEAVTLPDSVQSLGDQAFYGCGGLREVHLNEELRTIGLNVFDGAGEDLLIWGRRDGVQDAYAQAGGHRFADGGEMTFEETEGGLMLTGLQTEAERLVIPSLVDGRPVVSIGKDVRIPSAAEIEFPDGLFIIPDQLCQNNKNLIRVRIGEKTEQIGKSAFLGCEKLSEITWGKGLRLIGDDAFAGTGLADVTLPLGVTRIGQGAFSACRNLERLWMPDSVRQIDEEIFFDCVALREIRLSEELTEIPQMAFEGCGMETLVLPQNLRRIGWGAFMESKLKYLVVPAQVEVLEGSIFYGCSGLQWVQFLCDGAKLGEHARAYTEFSDFPADFVIGGRKGTLSEWIAGESNIRFEDMDSWSDCFDLKGECAYMTKQADTVRVPWFNVADNCPVTCTWEVYLFDVREITLSGFQRQVHDTEFYECDELRTVYAPGALEEIGAYAFSCCPKLESVRTEGQIRSIDEWAFEGDRSLREIDLSGVYRIGRGAFFSCESLRDLTLSARLTGVEEFAFQECGMKGVEVPKSLTSISSDAFTLAPVQWIILSEGCREIEGYGLINCPALRFLVLPPGMRQVSSEAVSSSRRVDIWVYQPDMVIEELAFYRWTPGPGQTREELWRVNPPPVIHGYPGSTAEAYARENGFDFMEIDKTYEETVRMIRQMSDPAA